MAQPNVEKADIDKATLADRGSLVDQILEVIVAEGKIDPAKATADATLESLEVQSIDIVMILMAVEEKFGVYVPIDGSIAEAKNLGGFIRQIEARIVAERS